MDQVGSECINGTIVYKDIYTPGVVITIVALSLLNIVVVLGNSLVVLAVITTRKLRTVTNIFIVSLACADLCLGFTVLPFSISVEVLNLWLWGGPWCSMWLAIDVWLCTASILSLCAISLDRYIAVTKPIRYPSIMSPYRGKVLVFGVWVLAFIICLPPLLGWNDLEETVNNGSNTSNSLGNSSEFFIDTLTNFPTDEQIMNPFNFSSDYLFDGILFNSSQEFRDTNESVCDLDLPICELTTTKGYRIYAAMGSFFIPMLVMVFFYCKIYMAAVKTVKSLRKGVLTTRTSNEHSHNQSGDEHIQMRIHRGGSKTSSVRFSSSHERRRLPSDGSQSPSATLRADSPVRERLVRAESEKRAKIAAPRRRQKHSILLIRPIGGKWRKAKEKKKNETNLYLNATEMDVLNSNESTDIEAFKSRKNGKCAVVNGNSKQKFTKPIRKARLLLKETKLSVGTKGHARKFQRETKAAKTVAIIVGAFIACWMPFFTIYLLGAFCYDCVPPLMFSIFFWLGYLNSALNPCIYALFARDFRFAFKRLVFCRRRQGFNHTSRADYITGTRKLAVPIHESDSISDY